MLLTDKIEEAIATLIHISNTEGTEDVGCLLPIRKYGESRQYGDFSTLGDWAKDVASTLEDYLADTGEEIEGWEC